MKLLRVIAAAVILAVALSPIAVSQNVQAVTTRRVVIYAGPVHEPYLADVFTSQPDGTAGRDTRMASTAPTTNFGSDARINVGEDNTSTAVQRTLIQFDLSSIPANATINSATLSLWQEDEFSSNTRTLRVYRMVQEWFETQATWNVYAGTSAWANLGAYGDPDSETTGIGSRSFTSTEAAGEKQWTLTASAIQEMIAGTFTNNGFLIKADTEANDMYRFRSSDWTTAGERPKLVIDYTVPTNTPTNTPTDTATNTPTATDTATATDTETPTATDTATGTPTDTPTATNTPTDTATPTATFTPSNTPTPSAYVYTLASGQTFIIEPELTFGEMVQGGMLVALLLVFLVYVIYRVIEKWA